MAKWIPGEPLTERDKEILRPLIEKAQELGRTPTKGEVWNAGIIKGRFRIWKNAIMAAGLPQLNDPEQSRLRERNSPEDTYEESEVTC